MAFSSFLASIMILQSARLILLMTRRNLFCKKWKPPANVMILKIMLLSSKKNGVKMENNMVTGHSQR